MPSSAFGAFWRFWCFLVRAKSFCKRNKEFKTALITSFILLLNFGLSHSFSIITTLFNHYNPYQLSQSFLFIITFFNYYDLRSYNLFYHNLFSSLYNLWHYLYENKPRYKFHHLKRIFYRQNITKIFYQFQ